MPLRYRTPLLLLALTACAAGQAVRCEVQPPRIFEGQEARYVVQVSGVEKASCTLPQVPGLTFTLREEGVVNQGVRIMIVNGRRTEKRTGSYAMIYAVEAATPGRYEIPAPQVRVEELELRGSRTTLVVEAASSQDLAFVEVSAEPADAVRGVGVTVTADFYLKHLPLRNSDPLSRHDQGMGLLLRTGTPPPEITIPWLRGSLEQPIGVPGLNGRESAQEWLMRKRARRGARGLRIGNLRDGFVGAVEDVERNGRSYRRYRFRAELRGDIAGRYELDPARLSGNLVEQNREQGKLFWREVFVRSEPLVVIVSDPPSEGRPSAFSGAVGRNLRFSLEPPSSTRVRVGDAIFLTLVVSGPGFLKGVRLDLEQQLSDGFRVEEIGVTDSLKPGAEKPAGFPDRAGQWRQFDYKLYPLDAAITEIPRIDFAYYDPAKKEYLSLTAGPLPIEVFPGDAASDANVLVAPGTTTDREDVELVPTAALSSNVDDLNLLGNQRVNFLPWLVALLAMPLVYFALSFFVRRHRRLQGDPALLRRLNAASRARKRLAAISAGEVGAKGPAPAISQALLGYVADLDNRTEEALTGDDLLAWAREHHADDAETLQALRALDEAAEAALFGAGHSGAEAQQQFLAAAERVLARDPEHRRRGASTATLLLALVTLAPTLAAQDIERFQAAQTHFAAGDYEAAARAYETMLQDGYRNGHVLYNLGNAWFRAGKLGHAIAAYRRAQRYLPGDANLEVNLQRALDARPRPLSPPEDRSLLGYVFFWRHRIPLSREIQLAVLAAALAFLAALTRLFLGRRFPGYRSLLTVALIATLLLATSAALDYHDQSGQNHGVIITDGTALRRGPGLSFEPSYEQPVDQGAELTVLQRRGDWLEVLIAARYEGWIPATTATLY